jgi:hypothetical protein
MASHHYTILDEFRSFRSSPSSENFEADDDAARGANQVTKTFVQFVSRERITSASLPEMTLTPSMLMPTLT